MIGKYSPTIFGIVKKIPYDENGIDPDGYDKYGYHYETELDRAGYSEDDYLVASIHMPEGQDEPDNFREASEYPYRMKHLYSFDLT